MGRPLVAGKWGGVYAGKSLINASWIVSWRLICRTTSGVTLVIDFGVPDLFRLHFPFVLNVDQKVAQPESRLSNRLLNQILIVWVIAPSISVHEVKRRDKGRNLGSDMPS